MSAPQGVRCKQFFSSSMSKNECTSGVEVQTVYFTITKNVCTSGGEVQTVFFTMSKNDCTSGGEVQTVCLQ